MSSGALGLLMFPAAMAAIALSGLPAYLLLLAVATLFGVLGWVLGGFDAQLASALPLRLLGLLEQDLLQALALYALVGALLQRLELAPAWLRCATHALRHRRGAAELAVLGVGALSAPMNGSVAASLNLLSRSALPALREAGLPAARATALVAVASTLGLIVPPSLVLLLLGDALMRAHTEALQASGAAGLVINNAALLRAALPAGALALALLGLAAWLGARREPMPAQRPTPAQRGAALAGALLVALLLAGVALGWIYAVEGAALMAALLLLYGLASGRLRGQWQALLEDAMALSGLLFALLVGASAFTLVLRGLGTDRWLTEALLALQLGPRGAVALVMGLLLASAFVLDAFELIFLLVPLLMPPLLRIAPDAAWVGTLTLLVLQIGFLLPPLGYALLMARAALPAGERPAQAALARAVLPSLAALGLVLAAVLLWPPLTHLGEDAAQAAPTLSPTEVDELMRRMAEPPPSAP